MESLVKYDTTGTNGSEPRGAISPNEKSILVDFARNLLGTSGVERPVAVVSDAATPLPIAGLGLPNSWSRHVVDWDEIGGRTQSLLNDGYKVLMIPPWGRMPRSEERQEGKTATADVQATVRGNIEIHEEILITCSAPADDTGLFVLLPASAVRSERSRSFRATIMTEWKVTHVVFMQGVLAGVHPSFECVLLGLRPPKYADSLIRFFDMWNATGSDSTTVVADFERLQKMKGSATDFGYVFRGDLDAGESLAYGLRDPRLAAKRADLAHFGHTAAVEELFEVLRSPVNPALLKMQYCEPSTPDAIRLISGRDLRQEGIVDSPSSDAKWLSPGQVDLLKPNDYLIPVVSSVSDKRGFTVAKFNGNCAGVASNTTLVLRPRMTVSQEVVDFAIAYLRSPVARKLYHSRNREMRLGKEFDQFLVPVPDEEILAALHELGEAQHKFLEWAGEAGRVVDSVFDYASVKEARPKIIAAGRFVRSRSREASNLDDPDFVVRRAFPYPIAHRWRVMEAALSGGDAREGYTSILDTAEAVLAFLAQVAFVLARAANIEMNSLVSIRRKLKGGSGPSMGDWAAVLQETTGKHFAPAMTHAGLGDIITMFRTTDVEDARVRLSSRRNDEAHNRRVEAADLAEATTMALTDLRTLTHAAEFLADMPLRHVTATSWDSFTRESTVTYRELIGDHWVVKSTSEQVRSGNLESGSLYVLDPEGNWHLMRPFLVARHCPQCRTISTFHVDTLNGGNVRFKSVENGHTVTDEHERPALENVGLL